MVSVAYPMGDVILLGAVVRLALDAGRREAAFWLLTGSIALLLVTDFGYGVLTLHDAFDRQLWLDAGWIGSYLLWGAAGLHPSMARLAEPAPRKETVLTRFRLGLLTLRLADRPGDRDGRRVRRAATSTRSSSRSPRSRCSRSC